MLVTFKYGGYIGGTIGINVEQNDHFTDNIALFCIKALPQVQSMR